MKMREELDAKEWGRLRKYCGEFTQPEIERKHHGKLAKILFAISQGKGATTGAGILSTALITQALRYCKQIPGPTGPGQIEEIQE